MTAIRQWTAREMLETAGRAVGKVDTLGARGATLVSLEETIAMATALAAFGLVTIPPGENAPARLIITQS